jgi:methylase of polypeptide subunit release factors
MMPIEQFETFLNALGYSGELLAHHLEGNTFTYSIEIRDSDLMDFTVNHLDLKYVYTPTEQSIFEAHSDYWNQNNVNVFIAVTDNTCHIINAREKPEQGKPLNKNVTIKNFDYGVNSEGFDRDSLKEILKDSVDSTYFFDFVIEKQKKTHEVDKDLLLNLIALRNDMIKDMEEDGSDRIVHLLILRCLFIKYLEDRDIYEKDYLTNILQSGAPGNLLKAFGEIEKINGDIFKQDKINSADIKPGYMERLAIFFSCDYRTGQGKLFPYRFDKIPVQLISSVYEAFLKSEDKKSKGIYYTPSFLVEFMLSHTLREKVKENPHARVLDPACGSGAFLVESFKMIIDALPGNPGFEAKKRILESQLFGIDSDPTALQIAAFSLYLVLLETERPGFIRHQIEHAQPVLPGLIGKTLMVGNALTEDGIFESKTFDCIVANPPWGSVPDDGNSQNIDERKALGGKGEKGKKPEYKNVAGYERSQAFLLRAGRWGDKGTVFSMVVKNSIFLSKKAEGLRAEFLRHYRVPYFYELSNLNKILFKRRPIGKIDDKEIVIGAAEPCVIIVFDKMKTQGDIVRYISPKLTGFSERFQLIHFSRKDIHQVDQVRFLEDDLIWQVLVKGSMDDYNLLIKAEHRKDKKKLSVICSRGFEPRDKMPPTRPQEWNRALIRSRDFERYYIKDRLSTFNWNRKLRRCPDETLFNGDRILIAYRPIPRDKLRLRCIFTDEEMVFRNDVLCFKAKEIQNYLPYLAILNSSFTGYYLFKISAQWDGGIKREALRTYDIKSFPFPGIRESDDRVSMLTGLIDKLLLSRENEKETAKLEREIDDLVFDLYGLVEYEREIVREFFQVNVERKKDGVKPGDIQKYVERFRENFSFFLDNKYRLNAEYYIAAHAGAAVCFRIVEEADFAEKIMRKEIPVLNIVKKKQLQQSYLSRMLNEDKVKIYDDDAFYMVKSNYFKDWTKSQALKDANEEIELLVKNLPER